VTDTGEGIAAELLPYVFDRFRQADSQTSRRHQGLGLGLAIVRHLVELHGGTVGVESAGLGQGAAFRVALPITPVTRTPEAPARARQRGKLVCPPELEGLRVLVVDDEEDSRQVVARVLRRCEVVVTTASGAVEGLEALRRERPDVLISDIGMPDVDGYGFIEMVRRLPESEGGKTPAIALTAFARSEDRVQALTAGFTTHIAKPITQSELLAVLAGLSGRNGPRPLPS
jgi:CheY-like chemotaxis protein